MWTPAVQCGIPVCETLPTPFHQAVLGIKPATDDRSQVSSGWHGRRATNIGKDFKNNFVSTNLKASKSKERKIKPKENMTRGIKK